MSNSTAQDLSYHWLHVFKKFHFQGKRKWGVMKKQIEASRQWESLYCTSSPSTLLLRSQYWINDAHHRKIGVRTTHVLLLSGWAPLGSCIWFIYNLIWKWKGKVVLGDHVAHMLEVLRLRQPAALSLGTDASWATICLALFGLFRAKPGLSVGAPLLSFYMDAMKHHVLIQLSSQAKERVHSYSAGEAGSHAQPWYVTAASSLHVSNWTVIYQSQSRTLPCIGTAHRWVGFRQWQAYRVLTKHTCPLHFFVLRCDMRWKHFWNKNYVQTREMLWMPESELPTKSHTYTQTPKCTDTCPHTCTHTHTHSLGCDTCVLWQAGILTVLRSPHILSNKKENPLLCFCFFY